MIDEHRMHSIRALSRKVVKSLHGANVDVAGAALATVIGTFLLDLSKTEDQAIGGLRAISSDAELFIRQAHVHKHQAQ